MARRTWRHPVGKLSGRCLHWDYLLLHERRRYVALTERSIELRKELLVLAHQRELLRLKAFSRGRYANRKPNAPQR